MSLPTLRELISRLNRLLKSGNTSDASDDASDASGTSTVVQDPIQNVQLSAFSFTINNISYIVSFTKIPFDQTWGYQSDRYLFRYYEHDPNLNKLIRYGRDYFIEEIENKEPLRLALKASQILSTRRIFYQATERYGEIGTETFDLNFNKTIMTYTKFNKSRYVSRNEMGGRFEYTSRYSCPDEPTEHNPGTIEAMIHWGNVKFASNFVLAHPSIVNSANGSIKWKN